MKRKNKRRVFKGTTLETNEIQKKDRHGNVRFEYRFYDCNGKRKSVSSPTIEGLRIKEEEINKRLYTGLDPSGGNITFGEAYTRWIFIKSNFLKPTTLSVYDYTYNYYIKDVFANQKIINIKKSNLKLFFAGLYMKGYKVGYLDAINKIIHGVFEMLIDDECLSSNPAHGVLKELKKRNPRTTGVKNALTVEQEDLLIDFLNSSKKYKFVKYSILFLFFSGVRFSEMAGLTWSDVDLKGKWIYINKRLTVYTKQGKGNIKNLDTPKTVNSVRKIPLLKNIEELLIEYKKLCSTEGYKCNETVDGVSGFIFFNEYTKSTMYCNTLNRTLKKIVRDCNAKQIKKGSSILLPEGLSTHYGRHTFATRANERNVNIRVTSLLLGHSKTDSSLTLNTYTDVKDSFLISEASKVYN